MVIHTLVTVKPQAKSLKSLCECLLIDMTHMHPEIYTFNHKLSLYHGVSIRSEPTVKMDQAI